MNPHATAKPKPVTMINKLFGHFPRLFQIDGTQYVVSEIDSCRVDDKNPDRIFFNVRAHPRDELLTIRRDVEQRGNNKPMRLVCDTTANTWSKED